MSDPLTLLRSFIIAKKPVQLLNESHKPTEDITNYSFIQFGNVAYAKNVPTTFKSKRGTSDYYTLDAVYFLSFHSSLQHTEYMQECRKFGVSPVSFVDRKDLLQYINGTVETCPFLDLNSQMPKSIVVGKIDEKDEKKDEKESISELYSLEKPSCVRSNLFISKNKVKELAYQRILETC